MTNTDGGEKVLYLELKLVDCVVHRARMISRTQYCTQNQSLECRRCTPSTKLPKALDFK